MNLNIYLILGIKYKYRMNILPDDINIVTMYISNFSVFALHIRTRLDTINYTKNNIDDPVNNFKIFLLSILLVKPFSAKSNN